MRNISYHPFYNKENLYCKRMQELLSNFGEVNAFNKKRILIDFLSFKRQDTLFLNWFENKLINRNGSLSFIGFLSVLFFFIIFRLVYKNFIFVRHNNYPHNCKKNESIYVIKIINFLEKIPHKVVLHSPVGVSDSGKRLYIPHPLYKKIDNIEVEKIQKTSNRFVIFGRIVRYKKIEEVISLFPDKFNLLIVGKCADEVYLEELKKLIINKKNIKIISEFLADKDVEEICANSQGMLITHNDEDMIVSGSFFYAMTINTKVFALETPFLKWVNSNMNDNHIEIFSSIEEMFLCVSDRNIKRVFYPDQDRVLNLFGDQTVFNYMKKIFE